jgi:predicted site-specific integrase-resolvase
VGYRLDALLTHLDVNHCDGVGGGEELIKELNEVIDEIMAKVHARRSRKENRAPELKPTGVKPQA